MYLYLWVCICIYIYTTPSASAVANSWRTSASCCVFFLFFCLWPPPHQKNYNYMYLCLCVRICINMYTTPSASAVANSWHTWASCCVFLLFFWIPPSPKNSRYIYLCLWVCICICTGWRRLIGSPKLQIIFHKRAIKYRSLLRKTTYKDKGFYESSPPCIAAVSNLCNLSFRIRTRMAHSRRILLTIQSRIRFRMEFCTRNRVWLPKKHKRRDQNGECNRQRELIYPLASAKRGQAAANWASAV